MNNSIIETALAAIAGAAAKYGDDLVADATPADADDTLRMARNIIARTRASEAGDGEVDAAAAGVVEQPDAEDRIEDLRSAVMNAAGRDGALASDLAIMVSSFGV